MISLEKVTKKYQSGRVMVKALDDVSLDIKKGEFWALTGASGSGKTTLLNIIGCLSRVTSGRFWLGDEEVSHYPDHFLAALRREKCGFIFQQFNLLNGYTTWENVAMPLLPMGISEKIRKNRAMQLLEELHLETRANFLANELSGGEQQRAAIARALINDPEIILADEPLSGIDGKCAGIVVGILSNLKARGKTIIFSSHELPAALAPLADRTLSCDAGKLFGAPQLVS